MSAGTLGEPQPVTASKLQVGEGGGARKTKLKRLVHGCFSRVFAISFVQSVNFSSLNAGLETHPFVAPKPLQPALQPSSTRSVRNTSDGGAGS